MQDILTGFDYSPRPASRTKRWLACFIDYIIYSVLLNVGLYIFGNSLKDVHGSTSLELQGMAAFATMFLTWVILFPGIEFINGGQTIGKAMFKVKTLQDDYTPLRFGPALVRHLFDVIDYLPFGGILGLLVSTNNKYKQRVGDLVAKTVVVDATYTPVLPPHEEQSKRLWR